VTDSDTRPHAVGDDGVPMVDDPAPTATEPAAEPAAEQDAAAAEPEKGGSFWRELPLLILVALVIAVLIKTFAFQAFWIPSGSMRETLVEYDRVMVNKLSYRFGDIERGDIIVFDDPFGEENDESVPEAMLRNLAESVGLSTPRSEFIKRVVAVGGETIEIRDNTVFVDGVALAEPYLHPGTSMPDFGPETVAADHVFVMGDNRNASSDSRRFGPIDEDTVVGRAFVVLWPIDRWSGL
jgi:signal peptidase I